MAQVLRSRRAEADLQAILRYLEERSPAAADRFVEAIEEKGRALANHPEMGRIREEIAPDLRSTLVKPYVIFYRIRGEVVEVLRILHGKQDVGEIIGAGDES
jgi:toxin ParE1/3/4